MIELLTSYGVITYYLSMHSIARDIVLFVLFMAILVFFTIPIFRHEYIRIIISSIVGIMFYGILSYVHFNWEIFSPLYGGDTEIINDYINKNEYSGCTKNLVSYNGNILHFSVIDYAVCIKKIKTEKFNNSIKINTL